MALCLSLTSCSTRLSLPAASPSGRQLRSSSLNRGTPLLAAPGSSSSGGASSRQRTQLQVAALLPTRKWWEAKCPPNVVHIGSVQQLVDTMATAGDRLVIVDVFAPWCAACKGIHPKLMQLLEGRPDVLCLSVNFDENKTIVKALGVKVLPYFMFYRGASGKLEGFSASNKRIGLILDALDRHSTPRCYLPSPGGDPVLPEFPNVKPKSDPSWSNGAVPAPELMARQAAAVAQPLA